MVFVGSETHFGELSFAADFPAKGSYGLLAANCVSLLCISMESVACAGYLGWIMNQGALYDSTCLHLSDSGLRQNLAASVETELLRALRANGGKLHVQLKLIRSPY